MRLPPSRPRVELGEMPPKGSPTGPSPPIKTPPAIACSRNRASGRQLHPLPPPIPRHPIAILATSFRKGFAQISDHSSRRHLILGLRSPTLPQPTTRPLRFAMGP
ncbi:hypothetical protein K461DRAFT_22658 [Myriangium duriaei CBS 260.36]|uniref:Uncharacterized protein n=1 Tax=Myriangium duriaei CBS 260.36 TaxID=1168546 RepID=A0A9P4JA45_9PEZI|nr:hypothetical protein K461DRAFT_22658 [Myriangium duriaei CBS 260.36]